MKSSNLLKLSLISIFVLSCQAKKEDEVTTPSTSVPLVYTSGQAASVVIGQPDFTSKVNLFTQSGFETADGVAVSSTGKLFTTERSNHRVMGFNSVPTSNGANADFVIGQTAFTNAAFGNGADELKGVTSVAVSDTQVFVADTQNSRVLIYNTITSPTGTTAALAIGQTGPTAAVNPDAGCGGTLGCGSLVTSIRYPTSVSTAAGKLAVVDNFYNKVLLYNTIPTTNQASPSVVLGQADKDDTMTGTTGSRLNSPSHVWTDGTRVVVSDMNNHRVFIWNTWPTTDGQVADLVLGQAVVGATTGANNGGTPAANTLKWPGGVSSNGTELAVSDNGNHRVLIWKTWPTANHQDADLVFGQQDFTTATTGTTSSTFDSPQSIHLGTDYFIVGDYNNNRFLVFKKQ